MSTFVSVEPVPELYPFLAVRDVPGAVDFYVRAFDAVEEGERLIAPDGRQVGVLQIAGQHLGVATESPELGTPSPETVGATTVRISLHVDDPDAAYAQAVAAGATEMFPVADQPYGMRQGRIVDPFGHHWLIGRQLWKTRLSERPLPLNCSCGSNPAGSARTAQQQTRG